jgi:hypothetical protein
VINLKIAKRSISTDQIFTATGAIAERVRKIGGASLRCSVRKKSYRRSLAWCALAHDLRTSHVIG